MQLQLSLRIPEEKQFVCSICNKRYSKRDDLKNHLNEHNATTTYTCNYKYRDKSCDKTFRVLTNFNRHKRTHTGKYQKISFNMLKPVYSIAYSFSKKNPLNSE